MLPAIVERGCEELWLNPGAESDELVAAAEAAGLKVLVACSIVALGTSPDAFHE
jgi:predicted CoA-binding protein